MAKAALAWLVRRWNLVMPPAMPKHRKVLEASWSFLVCPLVTYIDTKPKEHLPQYDELWMKSRPDIIWYHLISNTCANGSGKPGPCWEENASSHTLQSATLLRNSMTATNPCTIFNALEVRVHLWNHPVTPRLRMFGGPRCLLWRTTFADSDLLCARNSIVYHIDSFFEVVCTRHV